jgi:hypothetical protein
MDKIGLIDKPLFKYTIQNFVSQGLSVFFKRKSDNDLEYSRFFF